jgi:hypothetical protein
MNSGLAPAFHEPQPGNVEVAMRHRTKFLKTSVLLPIAVLWPVLSGSPAFASATTAAQFTIATCRGAMDDLGKVDAIAEEKHWATAPEGATETQNNIVKLRSAWTVNQGDDNFVVATGQNQIGGNVGTGNVCMVVFTSSKPRRDEFHAAMSAAMELKPVANVTMERGRMEMFEITHDGPAKLILQITSLNDGNVMMAAFASMNAPPSPQPVAAQVDGSVRAWHALDASTVFVLGNDHKLWREFDNWNNALQPRQNVDNNVTAFQPLDATTVFVLGTDGSLWREFGAWNNTKRPRNYVDGNVQAFQALDISVAYVLGTDGKLWREFGAWDNTQQPRQNVDANVRAFQAIDATTAYVLGTNGNLWREFGTWNNVLQPRARVDGNVQAFQAIDANIVYVLGTNGNLWREFGAWNNAERPRVQVDGNVKAFQAIDHDIVYVLGSDGNLWREVGTMQTRSRIASNVLSFQAVDDKTVYALCPGDVLFRMQVAHAAPVVEHTN